MRRYICILLAVMSATLLACTEQYLPEFGDPRPITVPASSPAHGPRLTQGEGDEVVLSWMERGDETATLRFSELGDETWSPATTATTDSKMFVNWADLPAVTALGGDSYLAYWLSYTTEAVYSYQVLTAHSADGGRTWSEPVSPHTDGTPTEHGFVSTYPRENGTGMIWLDGRHTPDAGMTLRGATIAADGSLHEESVLDDLVCDCCQTDIAVSEAGPVAVYRNRTTEEVRDIYVARNTDGQWLPGKAIADDGWVIAGCPVNGPAIAAQEYRVAVAWFTAADGQPLVKSAVSRNAGKSFTDPLLISRKNAIGRAGIAMIDRHSYVVSWLESDEKKGSYAIRIRAVTLDGQLGHMHTIGRTSLARAVPQMIRRGDQLVFAWTDEIRDLRKVVSVMVPILGFYD